MVQIGNKNLDITQQTANVEKTLEQTDNPRHRFLLQVYLRHRYLESAGRWEEILEPDMMVDEPVYRFSMEGQPQTVVRGKEQIGALYKHWTDTHQAVFYLEDELVSVGDFAVFGRYTVHQQVLGSELPAGAVADVDPDAYYLATSALNHAFVYNDRGQLIGEEVFEWDPSVRKYSKLDPADVLTTKEVAALLEPYIKPMPAFDDSLLPR